MGSTFSNFTVLPEIALAKINSKAPFDKVCYIGCGVTLELVLLLIQPKLKLEVGPLFSGWEALALT